MGVNGATRSEPLQMNSHLLSKSANQMGYFWDAPSTLGISHNGSPSEEGDSSSVTHAQPLSLVAANRKSHINAVLSKLYGDKCTNVPQLLTELSLSSLTNKEAVSVCDCVCLCGSADKKGTDALWALYQTQSLRVMAKLQYFPQSLIVTTPDTQSPWAHVSRTSNTLFCSEYL